LHHLVPDLDVDEARLVVVGDGRLQYLLERVLPREVEQGEEARIVTCDTRQEQLVAGVRK